MDSKQKRVLFGKKYKKRCQKTGRVKVVVEVGALENLRDYNEGNYTPVEGE